MYVHITHIYVYITYISIYLFLSLYLYTLHTHIYTYIPHGCINKKNPEQQKKSKWELIKIKNFCPSKDIMKYVKRQPTEW